jgi:hypothetical protein
MSVLDYLIPVVGLLIILGLIWLPDYSSFKLDSTKAKKISKKALKGSYKKFFKAIKVDAKLGRFYTFVTDKQPIPEWRAKEVSYYLSSYGYRVKVSEDKSYFEIRWDEENFDILEKIFK